LFFAIRSSFRFASLPARIASLSDAGGLSNAISMFLVSINLFHPQQCETLGWVTIIYQPVLG
jgi:hypothetical protein